MEMQKKVNQILASYRKFVHKLRRDKEKGIGRENVYLQAVSQLKSQVNLLNQSKIIGAVPGIEIGDCFETRAEMSVVGLHLPFVRGIDYLKQGDGTLLATSTVDSRSYPNKLLASGELSYCGEGGKRPVRSQRMEKGNLALRTSLERRVIRRDCYLDTVNYVYDGLYSVVGFSVQRGLHYTKFMYVFHLKRLEGQHRQRRGLEPAARYGEMFEDERRKARIQKMTAELEAAAEEDAELNRRGEPAINKLKKLPLLTEVLSKKHLQLPLIHEGVFRLLKKWLDPLPDGSIPNINVRGAIFSILADFPVNLLQDDIREKLKESGLGKAIMFFSHHDETTMTRKLAQDLINKWLKQQKVAI